MAVKKEKGKWRVDFWYYFPDGSRKRIRKYSAINSRRYAERYERELREAAVDGTYWNKNKQDKMPTFEQYQARFMKEYAEIYNKPSEIAAKKRILKNHLLPYFGKYPMDKIGRSELMGYMNYKLKAKKSNGKPYNPKTIHNDMGVMGKILAEAVEMEIIPFVPKVKNLRSEPSDVDFLNFDEADDLVNAADGMWRNMIAFALKTGLRQGELLGLQWKDIDFDNEFIMVKRSIFRGQINTPKSNKFRRVPLCNDAIAILKDQLKFKKGILVFSDKNGKLLTDGKCKWPLQRAYKRAGLRKVNWHMLRHTFASHLVMGNTNIKAVQEYLGHATLDMTLRYSHLSPSFSRNEIQKLNGLRHYRDTNRTPNLQVVDFK